MARTQFVSRYDFRAPGADPEARREIFGRAIEQAAYAEQHGMGALMLSEHHTSEDGYLPSPIPVAAAFAAVTSTIPIAVSALLVNLYDPIRLAEDMAVLDHLSGGRVTYTIGLGYREEEYALFGRPWQTRGRDIEAAIGVLLKAWSGEEFEHEGRRLRVTPTPYSRPHPFLFYGGGSAAAARRAARLGLNFQPQDSNPELKQAYDDECRAQGREPGYTRQAPPGPANVFCSNDPEAFWASYGQHLLADAQGYAAWRGADVASYVRDDSSTVEEMKAAGTYVVLTADELIERCLSKEIHLVTSHPACGGLPAEPSWESLRLICERVIPAVRA
jgi:alkanesulfonate monooxygenase SsuD/methylene tetrahydromethanopterin reductase-like flavin-dependent oxidoreductase (luciferase family)